MSGFATPIILRKPPGQSFQRVGRVCGISVAGLLVSCRSRRSGQSAQYVGLEVLDILEPDLQAD